jgi:hypothetical protein
MVYFQNKIPNLGKFWKALVWKTLLYFMAVWNISRTFVTFYDHLEHFVFIWYIFSGFGIIYQKTYGNPARVKQRNNAFNSLLRAFTYLHPPKSLAHSIVAFLKLRFIISWRLGNLY